jgi:hypothetical protein
MSFKFKCSFKITKESILDIVSYTTYSVNDIKNMLETDKTFYTDVKRLWDDELNERYVDYDRNIKFEIYQDPREILITTLQDVLDNIFD